MIRTSCASSASWRTRSATGEHSFENQRLIWRGHHLLAELADNASLRFIYVNLLEAAEALIIQIEFPNAGPGADRERLRRDAHAGLFRAVVAGDVHAAWTFGETVRVVSPTVATSSSCRSTASGRPSSGPPRARSPPCRERGPVRLALIGSGIKMSMAKAFHELAGALSGLEVTYDLIDREAASRADVARLIGRCRDDGYTALNVTYPFKEIAFGCVVVDDPSVQQIGAVNTVVFGDGGSPVGSNTDYSGLLRRWRLRWPDERPGVVALIGAGGVGRSTAFALGELGASAMRIADVEPDRVACARRRPRPTVPGSAGRRRGDGRVRRRWC